MSNTSLKERLRWKLWGLACKSSRVCPANAHSVFIYGVRRSVLIDQMCCNDANNNGSCWCGKVQRPVRAAAGGEPENPT